MKSKIACWILVVALELFSFSAYSEVWGGNIYLAADIGSISSPGFDTEPLSHARVSLGWHPHEGWGGGIRGIFQASEPGTAAACPGGCGSPVYYQNTVDTLDTKEIFASYSKPLSDLFTLIGNIGVAQSHYIAYTVNPNKVYETTTNNLVGGVGVQMKLYKKFSLRLQFDEILTRSFGSGVTRFNYISGGWLLNF